MAEIRHLPDFSENYPELRYFMWCHAEVFDTKTKPDWQILGIACGFTADNDSFAGILTV